MCPINSLTSAWLRYASFARKCLERSKGFLFSSFNLESLLQVAFTGLFKGTQKCEAARQAHSRFYFLFYRLALDRVSFKKDLSFLSSCLICSCHLFCSESSITSETSESKGASFKCSGFFPHLPSVVWYCLAEVSLPFQQPLIFLQRSWF